MLPWMMDGRIEEGTDTGLWRAVEKEGLRAGDS